MLHSFDPFQFIGGNESGISLEFLLFRRRGKDLTDVEIKATFLGTVLARKRGGTKCKTSM